MLQRYNYIRINNLIKKMTPRYEKQKETIREELRKDNALLNNLTYKVVNKKGEENSITFEDLIASASIEQLKQYRELLAYFKMINQMAWENPEFLDDGCFTNKSLPMKKNTTLKLELKK